MSSLKLQHFQTYSYTTLLAPFNNKLRNAWKLGLNPLLGKELLFVEYEYYGAATTL